MVWSVLTRAGCHPLVAAVRVCFASGLMMWLTAAHALQDDPCIDKPTLTQMNSGNWSQVRELMQARLDRLPVDAKPALRICMQVYLGAAIGKQGDLPKAEAMVSKAHQDAQTQLGADDDMTRNAALNLAAIYSRQGQYDKAIPAYRALLPITERRFGANSLEVLTLLRATSTALHWIGNFADALELDTRALAIAEQFQPGPGPGRCDTTLACDALRGQAAQGLASTLVRLKRYGEAKPLAQRAVALLTASQGATHADTLDAQLELASVLIGEGQRTEARILQQQVSDSALQVLGPNHPVTLKAQGNLAASAGTLLERQSNIAMLTERLARLKASLGPSHPDVLMASANLANDLAALSQPAQALAVAESAVRDMFARPDTLMFDDHSLEAWLMWQSRLTQVYVNLLIQTGRVADAFLVTETLKLRRGALSLGMSDPSVWPNEVDRAAFKAASRQLALIDQDMALARSLRQDLAALTAKRAAAFHEWQRQMDKVPTTTLPVSSKPPAWATILLQDAAAMVSYRFSGRVLMAFVAEGNKIRVLPLDKLDRVRPSVEAYRLTMRALAKAAAKGAEPAPLPIWRLPNGAFQYGEKQPEPQAQRVGDLDEVLRSLSQWLIEPVWPRLLGHERLLISVDQNLAHVPFESLPITLDSWAKPASSNGDTLGDHLAVGLLPSFALMEMLGERQQRYAKLDRYPLLAVGGAHYAKVEQIGHIRIVRPDADPKLGAMDVKQIWQSIQRDRSLLPMALTHWAKVGFNDLPGSLAEVDAIAERMDAAGTRRSLVLRGQQASEATIQRLSASGDLGNFRLLHFSTHGFLSDDEPALSAIVLKQVQREPGTDGYLTAAEISTLDLHSDLVVVSACDSGASATTAGAGAAGLSMALLQAGTVSSVLSLWPIEDEDARLFMEHFYADLSAGQGVPQALRRTRVWARDKNLSRRVVQGLVRWGP